MVTPSWVGQVDGFGMRVETREEGGSDSESTGAGYGLGDSEL